MINSKVIIFLKNLFYTLISNLGALLISALVTFIVPKVISVENYGYYQLYAFYATYVGFFHFGWMDGLFLRYGGKYYNELNRRLLKGELLLYVIFETAVSGVLGIAAFLGASEPETEFILCLTALSIVIINIRVFFMDILQCTGRMKEYSVLSIIGRIVYIVLIIGLFLVGYRGFKLLIIADIVGRIVSTVYGGIQCKEILVAKRCSFHDALLESWNNIAIGIKLLFATIASNMIIGVVRWGINLGWDVTTFAKVSLTLSISNLLMVFIRSVSLVLFPTLRRVEQAQLKELYINIRTVLILPMLAMLVLYYPIKVIVAFWLPQYAEALKYMALLFPMCIYESKTSMLIETYLKVLRKEKALMNINILTVILGILSTLYTCFCKKNLDLAVLSIAALLAFRCIVAELYLSSSIKIVVIRDIMSELLLSVIFISASWYIGGVESVLIYSICYCIYLIFKKKEIGLILRLVKNNLLN